MYVSNIRHVYLLAVCPQPRAGENSTNTRTPLHLQLQGVKLWEAIANECTINLEAGLPLQKGGPDKERSCCVGDRKAS